MHIGFLGTIIPWTTKLNNDTSFKLRRKCIEFFISINKHFHLILNTRQRISDLEKFFTKNQVLDYFSQVKTIENCSSFKKKYTQNEVNPHKIVIGIENSFSLCMRK